MTIQRRTSKAYEDLSFLRSPAARPLRILSEYIEPHDRLERLKVNSTVLFLGSARIDPRDRKNPLSRYYWEAEELAFRLARWAIPLRPKGKNFVVCTGAGPGIMEAANRGAARAGGKTIGMNIALPHEQAPNRFVSPELSFIFHYFFMRKFFLISRSRAVIAFPGGFGTLDELTEAITLIQTHKLGRFPIVLVVREYWEGLINWLNDKVLTSKNINSEDIDIFKVVDTAEEVVNHINAFYRTYELKPNF